MSNELSIRTEQTVDLRLLVPKELTFLSVLTKQCGVVPGLVDRWHHLILLSLEFLYLN